LKFVNHNKKGNIIFISNQRKNTRDRERSEMIWWKTLT